MTSNTVVSFVLPLISAFLWRLGGSGAWLGKAPRRFILPAIITLAAWSKRRKWSTVALFPVLVAAFSLGYGEKHPYWWKFIVGCLWVAPAIWLHGGVTWPVIVTPIAWIVMFKLSNTPKTANIFSWQRVEPTVGFLVGLCYV